MDAVVTADAVAVTNHCCRAGSGGFHAPAADKATAPLAIAAAAIARPLAGQRDRSGRPRT